MGPPTQCICRCGKREACGKSPPLTAFSEKEEPCMFKKIALGLAILGGASLGAYLRVIRPWHLRWGASDEELQRPLPGDDEIQQPLYATTRAVTIKAQPADIWPWLVQMGYQRGGLYSYDWLDRLFGILDRPSATRILPEFQHLAVGDAIPLGWGPSWPVAAIEPDHALVLDMRNMGGIDWVWQFGLYA